MDFLAYQVELEKIRRDIEAEGSDDLLHLQRIKLEKLSDDWDLSKRTLTGDEITKLIETKYFLIPKINEATCQDRGQVLHCNIRS